MDCPTTAYMDSEIYDIVKRMRLSSFSNNAGYTDPAHAYEQTEKKSDEKRKRKRAGKKEEWNETRERERENER